jgi:hypothetical protein
MTDNSIAVGDIHYTRSPHQFLEHFSSSFLEEVHFKAGSKVHLKHFLFANRLLELNSEVEKIAQKLALEISALFQKDQRLQNSVVTLVGYQLYTELLLSITQTLLKKENIDVRFKVISDEREKDSLYEHDRIDEGYILLIVPFGTTLQHIFEIKKQVEKDLITRQEAGGQGKTAEVLEKAIVLFLITDGLIGDFSNVVNNGKHFVNTRFKWETGEQNSTEQVFDIQNRTINIIDNSGVNYGRKQTAKIKYLYFFESRIYDASDCKLCIPDDAIFEQPLLTFDEKTRLPNISFGYPEMINKADNPELDLESGLFINGHTTWNETCFLHWIDDKEFYDSNDVEINEWISEISKAGLSNLDPEKVVIFSTGKTTKSDFLGQVNSRLFSNKANVIEYNIHENLLENFSIFYRNVLEDSKNKFFFYCEDIMDSESNFMEFEYFLSHSIQNDKNQRSHEKRSVFTGVFAMVNRMSKDSEIELNRHINNEFFYFYKLNLLPLRHPSLGCPLCNKITLYDDLIHASMLDYLKGYFSEKKSKIVKKSFTEKKQERGKGYLEKNYSRFIKERNIFKSNPVKLDPAEFEKQLQVFTTFKDIGFDEKLLYVVITHRLFEILCDDNNPLIHQLKSSERPLAQDFVKQLFQDISGKVLTTQQIKTLYAKVNGDDKKILTEKIEKIIIKLIAFPPFSLYRRLKEFVLTYTIMQLEANINSMGKNHYSFERLLTLKFYLNRSVLLSSNYLLRQKTLGNIKNIFDDGNSDKRNGANKPTVKDLVKSYEERLEIVKKMQVEPTENLPTEENGSSNRSEFLKSLEKNLVYRISRIQNFNYFIVSLIKQLIDRNAANSLILEKSLSGFFSNYRIDSETNMPDFEKLGDNDFFYLWRILKLENVYILTSFFNTLMNVDEKFGPEWNAQIKQIDREVHSQNDNIHYNEFYKVFRQKHLADENYEQEILAGFLNLSGNGDATQEKVKSLAHTFLLKFFLERVFLNSAYIQSEKTAKMGLEQKINFILEQILIILGFDKDHSSVSAFVIAKKINGESYEKKNIYSQVADGHNSFTIKENGIIYNMLNGLSQQKSSSPQTFIEALKNTDKWQAIRDTYFSGENEIDINRCIESDENIGYYDEKKHNYIFLFRLSEITDKDFIDTSRINTSTTKKADIGNAVFAISTNLGDKGSYFVHPDRLRLLLILRPLLDEFITKNFQNDSFIDLLQLKDRNNDINAQTHGIRRYMNQISTLIDKVEKGTLTRKNIAEYEFVFDLLSNQITNFFDYAAGNLSAKKIQEYREKGQELLPFSQSRLEREIIEKTKLIFELESLGNGPINNQHYNIKVNFINSGKELFIFDSFVLGQIFPEIIINIKKRFRKSKEDSQLLINWIFSLEEIDGTSFQKIVIQNTVDAFTSDAYETKPGKPQIKNNGGLQMCQKLLEVDEGTLDVDFIKPFFITTIMMPRVHQL